MALGSVCSLWYTHSYIVTQRETRCDLFIQGNFSGRMLHDPLTPWSLFSVCPLSSCFVLLRDFLLFSNSASFDRLSAGLWHLGRSECGLCVCWTALRAARQRWALSFSMLHNCKLLSHLSFNPQKPFVLEAVSHYQPHSFSSWEGGRYVTCSRTQVELRICLLGSQETWQWR